jgi:hypothetical protein
MILFFSTRLKINHLTKNNKIILNDMKTQKRKYKRKTRKGGTRETDIEEVSNDGMALEKYPELQKDKEVCILAVRQNGDAIRFVSAEIIDKTIALLAVNDSGILLEFVPNRLKNEEIIIMALLQNKHALQFIPDNLKHMYAYSIDSIVDNQQQIDALNKRLGIRDPLTPEQIKTEQRLYPYDKFMTPSDQIHLEGGDTVTIYIDLHGSMSMTPIPAKPTNTVIGSSVGLCSFGNPGKELQRLNHIKEIYATHPISEANRIYNDIFKEVVDISTTQLLDDKDGLQEAHPEMYWPVIQHQYITNSLNTDFIRTYNTERYYSISGESSCAMGIYIVHTTNERLADSVRRLPLMHTALPAGDFVPITQEEFNILQSQNLMNVSVATTILDGGMPSEMTNHFIHMQSILPFHIIFL